MRRIVCDRFLARFSDNVAAFCFEISAFYASLLRVATSPRHSKDSSTDVTH